MTAQLVRDCNAKAAEIGRAMFSDMFSNNQGARAQRKLLNALDVQEGIMSDIMTIHAEGITFEKWKESFLKWNSDEKCMLIDNAQGEIRALFKLVRDEADLEEYYIQDVLPMLADLDQIRGAIAGFPALRKFIQGAVVGE